MEHDFGSNKCLGSSCAASQTDLEFKQKQRESQRRIFASSFLTRCHLVVWHQLKELPSAGCLVCNVCWDQTLFKYFQDAELQGSELPSG